jgi:endoglucanase
MSRQFLMAMGSPHDRVIGPSRVRPRRPYRRPPVSRASLGVEKLEDRVLLSASAYVRVNQVGYVPGQTNQAMLMASGRETGATFQVVDASGNTVFSGPIGARVGNWSSGYPDVYALDFSAVTTPGTYSIVVKGRIAARSPSFQIDGGASLYSPLLPNALFFYEAQQDGPNVDPAVLDRQPSHLNDAHATVYFTPKYSNDVLKRNLVAVPGAGSVDVSGGWFDAGDYLKLVETASYTDAIMLLAVRDDPQQLSGGTTDFASEAMGETDWLLKMWNDQTETLYYQVGIGDGNGTTINGDHDIWRLPQYDDTDTAPGDQYIENRPVFEAGPPGAPVSPNLAGRLAADFALSSQVFQASDPAYASQCLLAAEHIFALAKTTHVGQLTTAAPYDYYPETSWQDDMELGATELYYATAQAAAANQLPPGLPNADPEFYLQKAASWAKAYISGPEDGTDSLNLYDVSGLAHYELYNAITQNDNPAGLAVTQAQLLADLGGQLDAGKAQAKHDTFGLGVAFDNDVTPHALGFALEACLYDQLTGTSTYAKFGTTQLNYVLGDNPWASSFIIGAGSTYPLWPQSQVPNLVLTSSGAASILLGGTVDGPVPPGDLRGLGLPSGPQPPNLPPPGTPDPFKAFNNRNASYRDNPVDYPCDEPADDYAALTVLLFAREASGY